MMEPKFIMKNNYLIGRDELFCHFFNQARNLFQNFDSQTLYVQIPHKGKKECRSMAGEGRTVVGKWPERGRQLLEDG